MHDNRKINHNRHRHIDYSIAFMVMRTQRQTRISVYNRIQSCRMCGVGVEYSFDVVIGEMKWLQLLRRLVFLCACF